LATLSLTITAVIAASAPAGPVADLAPADSILLIEVDDYAGFRDALARTPIGAFLHEPDVQDWFASYWTSDAETWRAQTARRGLDPDDLPRPAGAVGLALWADRSAASPMVAHALLYAEMGPDADLFERSLDALIDSARAGGDAESSAVRLAGREARRVTLTNVTAAARAGDAQAVVLADTFTLVRVGDAFLASTDPEELARALDRLDGARADGASSGDAYRDAAERLGPAHVRATLVGEPLLDALDRLTRSDAVVEAAGGVRYDARALAGALGFASVRAVALGATLGAPSAPMRARAVVLSPANDGLLGLFDDAGEGLDAPAAVGADALDVRRFGLRYERVIPMLLGVVEALPPRQREQARAMAGLFTAAVGPVFQSIGPETTLARWRTEDAATGGQRGLMRVRVVSEDALAAALGRVGRLIGLRARADASARVWTMGSGQALALDDGAMTIADRDAVAAAVAARPVWGEASLADSPRFRRAVGRLSPGAVFYSFTNLEENVRWLGWREAHWADLLRAELDDLGLPPAEIERWIEEERARREARGPARWPKPETVARHLGDAVAEVRSTPWGFEYRGWVLAPGDE